MLFTLFTMTVKVCWIPLHPEDGAIGPSGWTFCSLFFLDRFCFHNSSSVCRQCWESSDFGLHVSLRRLALQILNRSEQTNHTFVEKFVVKTALLPFLKN